MTVVLLLVVAVGVEHHRAGVVGEVALDLVADAINLHILAEVEELDVGGLHGVDGLDPGPLAQVLLVIGLISPRVHRDLVVGLGCALLEEG